MKKISALIIMILLSASPVIATVKQEHTYGLGDIICSTFLLGAGTWVAHKQLPRLAGQQIEFNAPIFTKVLASIFFTIGITGGIVGAYMLVKIVQDTLNNEAKNTPQLSNRAQTSSALRQIN